MAIEKSLGTENVDVGKQTKSIVECCQKLLFFYHQEGKQFFFKIVTDDESWVHHYDLEEKR